MKSEFDHAFQGDLAAGRGTLTAQVPLRPQRGSSGAAERTSVFARILADAGRGAREYVERWVAGRGAE